MKIVTFSVGASLAAALALTVACSSDSTDTTTGPDGGTATPTGDAASGDGATGATPQVTFAGTLKKGSGDNECRDERDLFEVGEFSGSGVKDGDNAGQGSVDISCSVIAAADGAFTVDASVSLSGATGGLFSMQGTFKTTGEQTGIHVLASSKLSANSYDQKDKKCVARYVDASQGVAAGRLWAEIVCPSAENTADDARACEITAQIRLENCTQ